MRIRTALLAVAATALIAYLLIPQWRNFDRMGDRRLRTLNHAPEEVVVGVCWPFAINNDDMRAGLELARDEINSRGLSGGIPIRLILRDDRFEWQRNKDIAIEFAENPNISAVLGYYDDSAAIKASAIFEPAQLLHLIVGANTTSMTHHGFRYLVRTIVSSDKIARSVARMLYNRGYRKFAIVWEEDAYGEDLAYQFTVGLDGFNLQPVYARSYSRERADFRLPANELKGSGADVIFFAGLEPWAGDFLRIARGVGLSTDVVGAFSNTPEMRRRAGQGLEGSMFFDLYNPYATTPANQAFVTAFRSRYGHDPDTWGAQSYDALRILARAVAATRSANPLDLVYSIRYMEPTEGANGRYAFNEDGEIADKPIYLYQFRNGSPVAIQTSPPGPEPIVH
jgi:branched-chain amino acid transport system substrate-binding protein